MIVKNPFTTKGNIKTGVTVSGNILKQMMATPCGIRPQPIYKARDKAWTVDDIPSPIWRLQHKGVKLEEIAEVIGKKVSTMQNIRAQVKNYYLSDSDIKSLEEFEYKLGK